MRMEKRPTPPAKKPETADRANETERIELLPFMRQSGASAHRTTSFSIPPAQPSAQERQQTTAARQSTGSSTQRAGGKTRKHTKKRKPDQTKQARALKKERTRAAQAQKKQVNRTSSVQTAASSPVSGQQANAQRTQTMQSAAQAQKQQARTTTKQQKRAAQAQKKQVNRTSSVLQTDAPSPVKTKSQKKALKEQKKMQKAAQKSSLGAKKTAANPPPGKRRKRHRKKRSYLLYYIFFGILLVSILFVLSTTVFFKLETIEVTGCEESEREEIILASGISLGDNLWQINTSSAEDRILSAFLNYDDVQIERKLPSGITITLTPSQIDMICVYENQYYSMSSGGRIAAVSDTAPTDTSVPLVYGCDLEGVKAGDIVTPTDENKISVLFDVIDAVKEAALSNVTHIDVSDITTIRLFWNKQAELKFGGTQGLAYEIECVKKLLDEQLEPEEIVIIDDTLMNGTYYMRPVSELSYPGMSDAQTEQERSSEESTPQESSEAEENTENSSESTQTSGETT